MPEIVLGNLRLEAGEQRLRCIDVEAEREVAHLEGEQVGELLDFVLSMAQVELNRRMAFRVPAKDSSGLSAVLEKDGVRRECRVLDIGLTGVGLSNEATSELGLEMDDSVVVHLDYLGQKYGMDGVVKRVAEDSLGVLFPCCFDGEMVDPPVEIQRIAMELQRRWIHERGR
ncbi:MAG: PilZ domain-containing protein [Aureliella sp.]